MSDPLARLPPPLPPSGIEDPRCYVPAALAVANLFGHSPLAKTDGGEHEEKTVARETRSPSNGTGAHKQLTVTTVPETDGECVRGLLKGFTPEGYRYTWCPTGLVYFIFLKLRACCFYNYITSRLLAEKATRPEAHKP